MATDVLKVRLPLYNSEGFTVPGYVEVDVRRLMIALSRDTNDNMALVPIPFPRIVKAEKKDSDSPDLRRNIRKTIQDSAPSELSATQVGDIFEAVMDVIGEETKD